MGAYMTLRILSWDVETSINKTIHSSTFRDPGNDIYTMIWSTHPDYVSVIHSDEGFKRQMNHPALAEEIFHADKIVGVNLSFDLCYVWNTPEIKQFVLKGGKIWDCQVAEYLLTGQQHTFASLAELQVKYLGEKSKPSRISYLYKKGVGADRIVQAKDRCPRLWALYNKYCKLDGVTPLHIFKKQYIKAKACGMLPIIELYQDYLLAIINMSCSGIKIDVTATEKTLREFNLKYYEYLEQAQTILTKVWDDERLPEFNINSPVHKSAVLFGGNIPVAIKERVGDYKNGNPRFAKVLYSVPVQGFGVSPSVSTMSKKDGVYSTDDSVMQRIAVETTNSDIKEYCSLQKQAMMYKKAAKTYCQAFLDRSIDGYLYPNFNNTLTKTGRLSSSEPNMQNISKRNEFGKILHSLFVAPEGWVCCQIDFSQLEIWVLAWLSNDLQLIEDLLNGVDLHVKRLQYYNDKTYDELYKLCKVDKDPYWDKQRTYAKTVSYQMAYGAGPKSVAASTGLDLDIVETIFKKEAETYSETALLSEKVRASVEATATFSRTQDTPVSGRGKLSHLENVELLPIFDKSGDVVYTVQEIRRVGYWSSVTGQKYHFLDTGRVGKFNQTQRNFSPTQAKNYPMQGTAASIQGATSAALLKALLEKSDKIKMINEVHDSKWFYIREDVLPQCLKYLREVIEDVPKIFMERMGIIVPFKFPVDIETGPNFGEMVKYESN